MILGGGGGGRLRPWVVRSAPRYHMHMCTSVRATYAAVYTKAAVMYTQQLGDSSRAARTTHNLIQCTDSTTQLELSGVGSYRLSMQK